MSTPEHEIMPPRKARVRCPRCQGLVELGLFTCPQCGFPMICDISPVETPATRARHALWRVLLGIAILVFWLVNAAFVQGGSSAYDGLNADAIAGLQPDTASGIPFAGPEFFIYRTQLALALLKLRAPEYYWRICDNVSTIEYLAPNYLAGSGGRRISLEGIGALAEPASGRVSILYSTAFPHGTDTLNDYSVFAYAGVLVHELRHIELHRSGMAPGGAHEEELCELAAYNCLKLMAAPGGVLARYALFFRDPQAPRYQRWYRWYDQW